MARTPVLSFDRGTLVLHPPPRGTAWITYAAWDDRVERFRIPAHAYRPLVESLHREGTEFTDNARAFTPLDLQPSVTLVPFAHQREALEAWVQAGRRGVVVLPTAAGKTYLAQMAMEATRRSTLIVVPTLDLLHQWYAHLCASFPGTQVGLLGGGSHDLGAPLLVSTYDSAARHAEALGPQYGLLVCDECHHLPGNFFRAIAECSIAPYRLGLTATPERADGRNQDLITLLGPEVCRRRPEELAGVALAPYDVVTLKVALSPEERQQYEASLATRNAYLRANRLGLGTLEGWQRFVRASARSEEGRRAMRAHHEARRVSLGTESKLRLLERLLAQHSAERTLIFTHDNATVYRIAQTFLVPALTHHTPVRERHEVLTSFRDGHYRVLAASHVLNEGVDVPEASVGVLLSGTGSRREFIQRLGRLLRKGGQTGKRATLYEVVAEDTSEENLAARRREDLR